MLLSTPTWSCRLVHPVVRRLTGEHELDPARFVLPGGRAVSRAGLLDLLERRPGWALAATGAPNGADPVG